MNLIVSAHLRESSHDVARRMAAEAVALAAGTPITQWVDPAQTVFRAQFRMRPDVLAHPLGALVTRFQHAAGAHLSQLIVVASSDLAGESPAVAAPSTRTLIVHRADLDELPASDDAPGTTQLGVPVAREPTPTLLVTPKVQAAPSPRVRAGEGGVEPVEFAVRAATAEVVNGFVVATGQPLAIQPGAPWDVVEGEILVFRPLKFWRFARHSLASGEFVGTRVDVPLFGGRVLQLFDRGGGSYELERPVLEGDPDDPADDPIEDARVALADGSIATARQLLRGALEENIRCLEAHDLLARTDLAEGFADRAARRDEVLLAFAAEALPEGFDARLPARAPGNAPVAAALARLDAAPRTPARAALTLAWHALVG